MKTVFISAGEASGDLHAAELLKHLQARGSGLQFFGLGGELMRRQNVDLLHDLRSLAVAGFWEVAKRIFHFRNIYIRTLAEIDKRKPDLAIFVDYPGLNLRLAEQCHLRGIKTVFYIVPQVWAWKKGRIHQIEKHIDLLLSILPFEKELFDATKIRCEFVGHPLLDYIDEEVALQDFRKVHSVSDDKKIVALLPGSRAGEVAKHYEIMLRAVKLLQDSGLPIRPFTAIRSELEPALYKNAESAAMVSPEHIDHERYSLLKNADISIVSSGTATLESALCGKPFCVVYRTGWITFQIARRVIKLNNVGLVNIVAGKEIVPEFLQNRMTPENLFQFGKSVLTDARLRESIKIDLAQLRSRLGAQGASERAAGLIHESFLS
ncbi:MAG: lipid-A-disaccharide synthase [Candidatus Zixiibacteriota bacterium]